MESNTALTSEVIKRDGHIGLASRGIFASFRNTHYQDFSQRQVSPAQDASCVFSNASYLAFNSTRTLGILVFSHLRIVQLPSEDFLLQYEHVDQPE